MSTAVGAEVCACVPAITGECAVRFPGRAGAGRMFAPAEPGAAPTPAQPQSDDFLEIGLLPLATPWSTPSETPQLDHESGLISVQWNDILSQPMGDAEVATKSPLTERPLQPRGMVEPPMGGTDEWENVDTWFSRSNQHTAVGSGAGRLEHAASAREPADPASSSCVPLTSRKRSADAASRRTIPPKQRRKQQSTKRKAASRVSWRDAAAAGRTGTPPPPMSLTDEECPACVDLNSDQLFADGNFKSSHPNERGRGAFAAALLCLLERYKIAKGHIHVLRGFSTDRWLLNRMPGRTNACLHFVNRLFFAMLGLKPYPSWRALARSLGDSRTYLPARHWMCLELKGGGINASTSQPWQAYQAVSGHFDRLANDLVEFLVGVPPTAAMGPRPSDSAKDASGSKGRKHFFSKLRFELLSQTQNTGKTVQMSFATVEMLKAALVQHWGESLMEASADAKQVTVSTIPQKNPKAKKRSFAKPVRPKAAAPPAGMMMAMTVPSTDVPFAAQTPTTAAAGFRAIDRARLGLDALSETDRQLQSTAVQPTGTVLEHRQTLEPPAVYLDPLISRTNAAAAHAADAQRPLP